MSFTSAIFIIIFFPICILSYFISDVKYRNILLFILSCFFYAWCGLKFFLLLLISSTITYGLGLLIEKNVNEKIKKIFITLGITYSIGILFYYKYFFTILGELNLTPFFTNSGFLDNFSSPALPLGISFYVFSILSYLLDVYWQKCKAQKNIIYLYLYVLFFPKIVQGPIMRYGDFEPQLFKREMSFSSIDVGLQRFIIGMFKKVVIADQLSKIISYSFDHVDSVGTISSWLGIVAYLIQLYYDFSGYSDMAIGLGLMFGFKLPENFSYPYVSGTVAEYWRRWHISLGEWFRDYCYMPLYRAFIKNKRLKKCKNLTLYVDLLALILTWLLTGIWHGSGLKYILYGFWWFVFIAIERIIEYHKKKNRKKNKIKNKKESISEIIFHYSFTIIAVVFGQVIFRAADLSIASAYVKNMLYWNTKDGWLFLLQLTNSTLFAIVVGIIFSFPVFSVLKQKVIERNIITQIVYRIILAGIFFISFAYAISAGYSPFLYQVF